MRGDSDGIKVVRAELCERLAAIQLLAGRSSARDLARSVQSFRALAAGYGMMPVVRLTQALEREIAECGSRRAPQSPALLYLERLQDAIGCQRSDEQASEAMLASVAIRLCA